MLKPWLGLRQHETLVLFKRPCSENKRQRTDFCPPWRHNSTIWDKKKKVFHSMNFSSTLLIRHKALFLFHLLSLNTCDLLCSSLICICLDRWQTFTERVLCARHWSSSCGYIRQQNTVTSLRKLMFWRKTDTDSSPDKWRRDCGRRCYKREGGEVLWESVTQSWAGLEGAGSLAGVKFLRKGIMDSKYVACLWTDALNMFLNEVQFSLCLNKLNMLLILCFPPFKVTSEYLKCY